MPAGAEIGLPASLGGCEDEACFQIFLGEEAIGVARSMWGADGSFAGTSRITVGDQTIITSIRIATDVGGRWTEIATESGDGRRTSTRNGVSVTRVFRGELREQTSTFETPRDAVLFDNDAPALVSHALRRYDRAAGGAQSFAVLIGGRPPVPLVVEAIGQRISRAGSASQRLTRFRYALPGTDLFVWADDAGTAYLVEHPAQRAAFVREGYAELRGRDAAASDDALLSAPIFEVTVERDVRVPMRDGLALATDIYRPIGLERAPVVLARTPYKKELLELQARFYARRGYVFAAQDCRGCFASPGVWEPFMHEGHDGYDTIEWLAQLPHASGRVGMIGGSYAGLVQWLAAVERPPHLAAMVPSVSPTDPFYNMPYEYGAFALAGSLWWADVLENRAAADLSGGGLSRIRQKRTLHLMHTLPVIDLDLQVLGAPNAYWREWLAHPTNDGAWSRARFLDRLGEIDVPVFHQSGWYDDNGLGTKLNYLRMAAHGHANQKLTLGAWGHTDTATRTIGDRDFGEDAIIDLARDYLRWFDRWLKGVDNGIDREPPVSVFVMGSNRWIHDESYPLSGTAPRRLYLASGGRLSFDPPAPNTPPDRYTYDPADPTPTTRLDPQATRRTDIVVYETEPLAEPLTVAGPLSAVLYAASSARDTDWFVTLSELNGDGEPFRLVQGKVRARFRRSMEAPELLEPDTIYEYTIDLWHTAITIPVGGRLRVEVASAAFPLFSRNLNTGGHNETETTYVAAHQVIHHDDRYPSHIVLPVLTPGW